MRNTKRIIASVVALSMLLSLAACSKKSDKAEKDVIAAAEDYADAVLALKAKNIIKLCNEDSSDLEEMLTTAFDFDETWGEDAGAAYSAIIGSMEAEVDEDSVDVDDDEASVTIIFTMPDYEEAASDEDNMTDVDAYIDALGDVDTIEAKVKVEFELEDDEWVVSNLEKNIEKIFPFIGSDVITFAPSMSNVETSIHWWFLSGDAYEDVVQINFELEFEPYIEEYIVYYTVAIDGSTVYTSEALDDADIFYGAAQNALTNDAGYLVSGRYTVTFYDFSSGEELCSDSVNVIANAPEVTDTPAPTTAPATPGSIEVTSTTWYYYDNLEGDVAYYTDTTGIDLDIRTSEAYDGFYAVLLNDEVAYVSDVEHTDFYEGYYRQAEGAYLYNGYLSSGVYTIVFFTADEDIVYSGQAVVTNTTDGGSAPDVTPGTTPNTPDDEELGTEWFDPTSDFANSISDISANGQYSGWGWWSYEESVINDSCIFSTDEIISYSLLLVDGADRTQAIDYVYYYTEDGELNDSTVEVCSNTITPTVYDDGAYYDIDMNGDAQPGYYYLLVSVNGNNELVACCKVQ